MEESWVVIRKCNSLPEAEFIQSILEGDGIESVIPDQNTTGLTGLPILFGGVRVAVREQDVARAEELLAVAPIPDELLGSDPLAEGDDATRDN